MAGQELEAGRNIRDVDAHVRPRLNENNIKTLIFESTRVLLTRQVKLETLPGRLHPTLSTPS